LSPAFAFSSWLLSPFDDLVYAYSVKVEIKSLSDSEWEDVLLDLVIPCIASGVTSSFDFSVIEDRILSLLGCCTSWRRQMFGERAIQALKSDYLKSSTVVDNHLRLLSLLCGILHDCDLKDMTSIWMLLFEVFLDFLKKGSSEQKVEAESLWKYDFFLFWD